MTSISLLTLPPRLTVTSGTNAIAHAVEALYAQDRNPVISMMAQQAIAAMGRTLPAIVANPQDREARAEASIGIVENDIERAADLAVQNPYWNPRPIEEAPFAISSPMPRLATLKAIRKKRT